MLNQKEEAWFHFLPPPPYVCSSTWLSSKPWMVFTVSLSCPFRLATLTANASVPMWHTVEVTHTFVSEIPEPWGHSSSETLQHVSVCHWEWAAFPIVMYLAPRTQRHLPSRMFSLVVGGTRQSTFSFTLEMFLHLFGDWALKSFALKSSKPSQDLPISRHYGIQGVSLMTDTFSICSFQYNTMSYMWLLCNWNVLNLTEPQKDFQS